MRILLAVVCVLSWGVSVYAQTDNVDPACVSECSVFTSSCTVYVECKIAESTCFSNCMQRKVWEKVALSLDKLTAVLEKQAREKEEKEKAEAVKEKSPEEKDETKNTSMQY
jgi:hypothetical protein